MNIIDILMAKVLSGGGGGNKKIVTLTCTLTSQTGGTFTADTEFTGVEVLAGTVDFHIYVGAPSNAIFTNLTTMVGATNQDLAYVFGTVEMNSAVVFVRLNFSNNTFTITPLG